MNSFSSDTRRGNSRPSQPATMYQKRPFLIQRKRDCIKAGVLHLTERLRNSRQGAVQLELSGKRDFCYLPLPINILREYDFRDGKENIVS